MFCFCCGNEWGLKIETEVFENANQTPLVRTCTVLAIYPLPPYYLIGQNSGGQNFRRRKFFGRQNFRHQVEIRQLFPTKFFHRFLISPYNWQEKYVWTRDLIYLTCFRFQRTKFFGGQNFLADKIFGSKSDFRQFSPPKISPIRYTGVLKYKKQLDWNNKHPCLLKEGKVIDIETKLLVVYRWSILPEIQYDCWILNLIFHRLNLKI